MHNTINYLRDTENLLTLIAIIGVTFLIATIVRKILQHSIEKKIKRHNTDLTTFHFIQNLVTLTIYLVGIGWALLTLPISSTYAHTLLASAGASTLIMGFAAQQVLGNIVSGVYLIITKPFKVHDIIEISSNKGRVIEINLHETILETEDDKHHIIIPNSVMSAGIIVNYSRK